MAVSSIEMNQHFADNKSETESESSVAAVVLGLGRWRERTDLFETIAW